MSFCLCIFPHGNFFGSWHSICDGPQELVTGVWGLGFSFNNHSLPPQLSQFVCIQRLIGISSSAGKIIKRPTATTNSYVIPHNLWGFGNVSSCKRNRGTATTYRLRCKVNLLQMVSIGWKDLLCSLAAPWSKQPVARENTQLHKCAFSD